MRPSTTSRVSPQAEAFSAPVKPSPQSPLLGDDNNDDGAVRVISNGRLQCPYPAAKAWVSEAVPATGPDDDDDLSVPATATWVYRQRRDFDDEGGASALVGWLAALLCVPGLGSGRHHLPASRENSVDLVSTWQKAQAEAAARRVVPVLKRASELTPPMVPNTPESSLSDAAPTYGGPASLHGSITVGRPGSVMAVGAGVRSSSSVAGAQRPLSYQQLPPFRASSGDLVDYVSEDLAERPLSSRGSGSGSSRPDSRQTAASSGQISKRSVRFG